VSPRLGRFRSAAGRAVHQRWYRAAMALLPPPDRTADTTTSYGTVRTYAWSGPDGADASPVLLLPGRSAGAPMWAANLPEFRTTHRVLAVDALGDAGLSVQTAPLRTPDDQARWIDEVVTSVAPEGVHVVGHSFGGATAAQYASRCPGHVRSLVLLEPVFTFAWPPLSLFGWSALGSLPLIPQSWRESALGRIGGTDFASARDDPAAQVIAAGTRHFAAALPLPRVLSSADAERLTMPVYVAVGDRDSLSGGGAGAARARRLLPHATVQVWPGTTHSLPMQVPHELAAALRSFWGR